MANNVLNGIMGFCIADALGVPVEFVSRETLRENPVINMRSYGTYNQPAGTWSDDSSMTLCLVDSLSKGLDYTDIMNNFTKWINLGEYTPYGEVFDVGNSTKKALLKRQGGAAPLDCGGSEERDNGNGSLMRILPIAFYLESLYGNSIAENEEAMTIIHNVSKLTHAHKRSLIACGIYISVANMLMSRTELPVSVETGIDKAVAYYKKHGEFTDELDHYESLSSISFAKTSMDDIKSSGYVVDTLEAAIWCLLNTKTYKDCVLMAVNLGEDTDTIAALAGGLAGLFYGYESIPNEWLLTLARRYFIDGLCNKLNMFLI